LVFIVLRGQEDTWIKDGRGVWIKHGNPSITPAKVKQQQDLIAKAQNLFQDAKVAGIDFLNGPCLGSLDSDYVVDIVHNPRQNIDNLPENQCSAYREGKAHHFIELDSEGNIIKIE